MTQHIIKDKPLKFIVVIKDIKYPVVGYVMSNSTGYDCMHFACLVGDTNIPLQFALSNATKLEIEQALVSQGDNLNNFIGEEIAHEIHQIVFGQPPLEYRTDCDPQELLDSVKDGYTPWYNIQ